MIDKPKVDVFPHGFFQDIKNLMDTLGKDSINKKEVEEYIKEALPQPKPINKTKTRIRLVGKPVKPGRKRR